MKFLIKLGLIFVLLFFCASGYKLISFKNGLKFVNTEEDLRPMEVVEDVFYYDNPFSSEKAAYIIIIETSEKLIPVAGNDAEIITAHLVGIFIENIEPQRLNPIPWWVYLIGVAIVVFIPFEKKQK